MAAAITESVNLSSAKPMSAHAGLLRFTTAGSVDDGKSTLIGRLLYDTQGIYEDQLVSIRKSGINRSSGPLDLSLVTDGLRAEREQGITIDVAYRYFSTPRRKFIITDTPGHEQYTRNMATGASNAHAAVILIDATRGVQTQSRRHTCIAALLGIQHVVAAVNKMDLVDYREEVFRRIAREFEQLAVQLGIAHFRSIPVSALHGDNIVQAGRRMPWFTEPTLLEYLEDVPVRADGHAGPLRLPVQCVIRPDANFRGFAGRVASGVLRRGATVTVLPSGARSRVKSITTFDGELAEAIPGRSVTVTLEDEIDLGRGDLLAGETGLPQSATCFEARLVWLHAAPYRPEESYLLKHGARTLRARIGRILHRLDVNTLGHLPAAAPQMNDIAAVHVETTLPLFFDPYSQDRVMGSFILIDPMTNATVAAGMIERKVESGQGQGLEFAVNALPAQHHRRNGHPPAALWIVNRPGLAERTERALFAEGRLAVVVSDTEFPAATLSPVVAVLQRMGALAIFSLAEDSPQLRSMGGEIYGQKNLLTADGLPSSDDEACAELLRRLDELPGASGVQQRQTGSENNV
jgi:sulfate adenylyltransferase subunit 1